MGARMGPGTYAAAWRAAGRVTAAPHPRRYRLTRGVPIDLPTARKVIYIACVDEHARYVGSTGRGVRVRLIEHVRDRARALWEDVWVISLSDELSDYGILLAEERVGRLLQPDENRRPPGR